MNSAITDFNNSGSASTSIDVIAIDFPAIKVFGCASGLLAASLNSRVCMTAVEFIVNTGWIEGLTRDTFPMSVEPSNVVSASPAGRNVTPSDSACFWYNFAKTLLCFMAE